MKLLRATRWARLQWMKIKQGVRFHRETNADFEQMKRSVHDRMPSTIGRRLMDMGMLNLIHKHAHEEMGELLRSARGECRFVRELHEVTVSARLMLKLSEMSQQHCLNCLYMKSRCVCNLVTRVKPRHKLMVLQSVGDYGRSNNSASLLCLMAGASRTLRGFQQQEDRLLRHMVTHKQSTVIVYPSDNAMPISEFYKNWQQERNIEERKKSNDAFSARDDRLTLVLLDGTWSEAANMDKFIPRGVQRVRLKHQPRVSWLSPIRGQSRKERVCTAQGKFKHDCLLFLAQVTPFTTQILMPRGSGVPFFLLCSSFRTFQRARSCCNLSVTKSHTMQFDMVWKQLSPSQRRADYIPELHHPPADFGVQIASHYSTVIASEEFRV